MCDENMFIIVAGDKIKIPRAKIHEDELEICNDTVIIPVDKFYDDMFPRSAKRFLVIDPEFLESSVFAISLNGEEVDFDRFIIFDQKIDFFIYEIIENLCM